MGTKRTPHTVANPHLKCRVHFDEKKDGKEDGEEDGKEDGNR
jgi:hypothetical protein